MKLSLTQKIILYLKSNSNRRYTSHEIANYIIDDYPDFCNEKKLNTSADTDSKLKL